MPTPLVASMIDELRRAFRTALPRPRSGGVPPETVLGRDDRVDEVWAIASTDDPAAVAVSDAAAALLDGAITDGAIQSPRRSIRFVRAAGPRGVVEILGQTRRFQPPLAGLLIGGDVVRAGAGDPTWSLASFVDRLAIAVLGPMAQPSEPLLADPRNGFPCPRLAVGSGGDPATLGAAIFLYIMAEMATPHVMELAGDLRARGELRSDLHRLRRWLWGGQPDAILAELSRDTVAAGDPQPALHNPQSPIPLRRRPFAPDSQEVAGHCWWLYLADGDRTLEQVVDMVRAYNPAAQPAAIEGYLRAAAELEYVELIDTADLITKDRLVADLRSLGIAPGMDLLVHSSLSKIGPVKGGASTVVDALLEAIGPAGTLMMPSFNHYHAGTYNPLVSPTLNGAIADAMWRRPDAHRSLHGSHSVCAIGPRASQYLADHLANGIWGAESPIGRLVQSGGYILSLGVNHHSSTVYHVAEISVPCGCIDQFGSIDRIVGEDGLVRQVPGLSWRDGGCPVDTKKRLDDTMDQRGLQRRGKVGEAGCTLCLAKDLWLVRREHLKDVCPTCPIRPKHRR